MINPLGDRVIIEPDPAEKENMGLTIPDSAKEKPQKGTVVAVGTGNRNYPMTVKVNDSVIYGKYAGMEITIKGVTYLVMREPDIIAII
jgi:chaperonin GroES